MMLPARASVALGEFDGIAIKVVDGADMLTVRPDDFKMLADLFRVNHKYLGAGEPGRVPG